MSSSLIEIEVLIFTALGSRLAVDTNQVERVLEMEQAYNINMPVDDMHGLIRGMDSAEYKSPKVLLIKHHAASFGVVVDRVEEIEVVGLDRIQPMPALIEKGTQANAVWGGIVDNDDVILLIDFNRLPLRVLPGETGENISR